MAALGFIWPVLAAINSFTALALLVQVILIYPGAFKTNIYMGFYVNTSIALVGVN